MKKLSIREKEVLELLADNMNKDQIARKLLISTHTVKNHLHKIYLKLGVDRACSAVCAFYKAKP